MSLDDKVDSFDFLSDDSVSDKKVEKEPDDKIDSNLLVIEDEENKEDEDNEEGDSEEKGEDEEDKEEEDEAPEDLEIIGPISRKEVLAKYPKIFKEFPGLEAAYYREQKYAEILPTIDDAKEALERSNTLGKFENEIGSGNIESVLSSIKQSNPSAFGKVVDNYLTNLQKVDQGAYTHILGNVFSNAVATMLTEGKRINNEDLQKAAVLLHQYVFGTSEYKAPTRFSKESPEGENSLEKEKKQFAQQRFESARSDVMGKAANSVKSTIAANIDPKGSMSDYVKRTAIRDCQEMLDNTMAQDARFRSHIDKLWERAFSNNFNSKSMDEIRNAYLNKAKTLLPTIIGKTRSEAMKGLKVTGRPDKDRKGPLPRGKSASPNQGGNVRDKAKAIPSNKSSLDYLMED